MAMAFLVGFRAELPRGWPRFLLGPVLFIVIGKRYWNEAVWHIPSSPLVAPPILPQRPANLITGRQHARCDALLCVAEVTRDTKSGLLSPA